MNSKEKIVASNLASALMVVQLLGGAFVAAFSMSFSFVFQYLIFIGLLLMLTSPFYLLVSVERQERLRRRQENE